MATVLVTNLEGPELLAEMAELLSAAGHDVRYHGVHPGWDAGRIRELVPGIQAIIAGGDEYPGAVLAHASELRILARVGIGFDLVDIDAATANGILVTNTPGVSTQSVADMAMALLLASTRSLYDQVTGIRQGRYEPIIGPELSAITLGLLGCGRIGSAVALRGRGFGMRILAHDPSPSGGSLPDGVKPVELDYLLRESDVLSLHIPLTESTRHTVNGAFLESMRRGSYLINTARGGLIDEDALLAALDRGQLAGAGLDVLGSEPPVGSSITLARHPLVLATPHAAGYTHEAERRGAILAVQAVIEALDGRRPDHLLNPSVLSAA